MGLALSPQGAAGHLPECLLARFFFAMAVWVRDDILNRFRICLRRSNRRPMPPSHRRKCDGRADTGPDRTERPTNGALAAARRCDWSRSGLSLQVLPHWDSGATDCTLATDGLANRSAHDGDRHDPSAA